MKFQFTEAIMMTSLTQYLPSHESVKNPVIGRITKLGRTKGVFDVFIDTLTSEIYILTMHPFNAEKITAYGLFKYRNVTAVEVKRKWRRMQLTIIFDEEHETDNMVLIIFNKVKHFPNQTKNVQKLIETILHKKEDTSTKKY